MAEGGFLKVAKRKRNISGSRSVWETADRTGPSQHSLESGTDSGLLTLLYDIEDRAVSISDIWRQTSGIANHRLTIIPGKNGSPSLISRAKCTLPFLSFIDESWQLTLSDKKSRQNSCFKQLLTTHFEFKKSAEPSTKYIYVLNMVLSLHWLRIFVISAGPARLVSQAWPARTS